MFVRLLIDGRKLGDGGIGTYLENLLRGLDLLQRAGDIQAEISVLIRPDLYESYRYNPEYAWLKSDVFELIPESSPRYSLREYFLLASNQRELLKRIDLFHSPHYTLPFGLSIPSVATIHDLIHLDAPETFFHKPAASRLIRSTMRRAEHILAVSAVTAKKIRNFAGDLSVPISVVPNALSIDFADGAVSDESDQLPALPKEYCLFVGSDRPHKGFDTLLDVFAKLNNDSSRFDRVPRDLVVVGERFSAAVKKRVLDLSLGEHIHFIGGVRRKDLAEIYKKASALLAPSRDEGFGLPVLEAMASSTAVVCTGLPSFKEVAQGAAYYDNEFTSNSFLAALSDAFNDPQARAERVCLGQKRAQRFTVQSFAKQTFEVYRTVLFNTASRNKHAGNGSGLNLDSDKRVESALKRPRRVALIHDWLIGMRGGERCLEALIPMFEEVDIYTGFYDSKRISECINTADVHPSVLSRLPGVKNYYRYLLPLYPLMSFQLSRALKKRHAKDPYDAVISISHCFAKSVSAPEGVEHICYCLTPMRYIWDQYDAYFAGSRLEPLIRPIVKLLRPWDRKSAEGVNQFVAISDFIKQRIKTVYDRESVVIYPPVLTSWLKTRRSEDPGRGFLCVSALVPYKNVELIVRAFNALSNRLTVVGSGPGAARLKELAGPNIAFVQDISPKALADLYESSRALVFAAEEDFGIVAVEAQAAGRPVICYGKAGVLETVRAGIDKPTGVYFTELSEIAIQNAVREFISRQDDFTVDNCVTQAKKFSLQRFHAEFYQLLAGAHSSCLKQGAEAGSLSRVSAEEKRVNA